MRVFLILLLMILPARASEFGIASWYNDTRTASGERFDPRAATCAHRTLPFGTWLLVTDIETGRSTRCRVNDRGPFSPHRIVDVTRRGADELNIRIQGLARVRVDIVQ